MQKPIITNANIKCWHNENGIRESKWFYSMPLATQKTSLIIRHLGLQEFSPTFEAMKSFVARRNEDSSDETQSETSELENHQSNHDQDSKIQPAEQTPIETSKDNFINSLSISCYSFTKIAKVFQPILNQKGSLVTLSFYGANKVMPNYNVMGVAKAALETSVKYLSVDLGDQNIRVNAISAGPMRTLAGAAIANAREVFKYTNDNSSLKRNVDLQELGNSALYLVSDMSSAVTGEIHYVDCGFNIVGMPKA